ncbi:carbohydrate kinase [Agromyces sp. ISL-38]|uniref:FGGY-family carbohydrate kinase n=1 Tax=Agromyces sp. ISL-38 TaxID=2819107 RepID=UPI001BEC697D|nr:FGGY family carbohydrate kinase [Agromyces sp. ISL-38]MBT2497528.1 carbohydrate kinase [Agromyces sp. ISL-38]
MSEPAWVGIDLGTQSVRAIALDDHGRSLAMASSPLHSSRHGDRHEQDPGEWWSAAVAVLRDVTSQLPPGVEVRALAVSGTSGTVVPVDAASGRATGPAVMYDDRRGAAHLERVAAAGSAVWTRLGYRMQASWALPKLLSLLDEGVLPSASAVAHQPDVITSRLAGRRMPSDLSSALKSGADLDTVSWPVAVFEELGLAGERMPQLAPSGALIGEVSDAASRETGLPAGCAIVAGMTDGCAAQIAAGALGPGAWNSVLGTTLVLKGVAHERRVDPSGAVYSHRAPFGTGWYPGGASSTGAGAISAWLPGRDLDALTRGFDAAAPPPVAYPLVGRGERFPFVSSDAEAFLPGAGDDASMFAAILHGVAYVERLAFDLLAATGYDVSGPVLVTGGGARNPVWTQLRADVLGRPVHVPEHGEGAAGMAVLAAAGAGAGVGAAAGAANVDPLATAAARMLPAPRIVPADAERHERLMPTYVRFVDELDERGWIGAGLAASARERSTR